MYGSSGLSKKVNHCIEASVAPQDDEEPLKRWATERGVEPGIAGPPVCSNEMARAVMKIRDKLAQLPDELPGIIVISTTGSALFHRYDLNSIIGVKTPHEVLREKLK